MGRVPSLSMGSGRLILAMSDPARRKTSSILDASRYELAASCAVSSKTTDSRTTMRYISFPIASAAADAPHFQQKLDRESLGVTGLTI